MAQPATFLRALYFWSRSRIDSCHGVGQGPEEEVPMSMFKGLQDDGLPHSTRMHAGRASSPRHVRRCPRPLSPWVRCGHAAIRPRKQRSPGSRRHAACTGPARLPSPRSHVAGRRKWRTPPSLSSLRLVALPAAEVMEPAPDLDFSWLCTPRVPFLQKPSRLPPFFKVNQLLPW